MLNRITIVCAMVAASAIGQAQQSDASAPQQSRGLLARIQSATTRQQLQAKPLEIAQPAQSPQGYRPGVTFPQNRPSQPAQPAQPQQPSTAPPLGYPPPTQTLQYNRQPTAQQSRPAQAPGTVARPTGFASSPTPSGQASSSNRSRSSTSDDSDNKKSSSKSSSNKSSSSRDSDSSAKKSTSAKSDSSPEKTKSETPVEEKQSSSPEAKSTADSSSKKSDDSSASALEKIVKKVESGTKGENEVVAKPTPVKKTKEEIEAEKAHQALLKEADKATTVVATFLEQANGGVYSKATETLAPAIKKYFDSEISVVNGTEKQVLDELTGNGNITMVTYVNTTVRGEGAVVEAELGYQDGRTVRRSFDLIQLDGKWKIVLPVTGESTTVQSAPAATPVPAPPMAAAPAQVPTPEQAAASVPPLVMAPAPETADGATTTP